MRQDFIFKGRIKCEICALEFVPNVLFFKGLNENLPKGKNVSIKGVCPGCDNELCASFEIEHITRELSKTYTMRCK